MVEVTVEAPEAAPETVEVTVTVALKDKSTLGIAR